jgi:hypothetical protein
MFHVLTHLMSALSCYGYTRSGNFMLHFPLERTLYPPTVIKAFVHTSVTSDNIKKEKKSW